MHRIRFALVLMAGLLPAQALAQGSSNSGVQGPLTVTYDGTIVDNQSMRLLLNAQQCADNIDIGFRLRLQSQSNLTGRTLEAWLSGTGTDCVAEDNRQDAADGQNCSTSNCDRVADKFINSASSDLEITIKAQDLFGIRAVGGDDEGEVEGGSGACLTGFYKVTLVAVSAPNCRDAQANELVDTYTATFELVTQGSTTPTDVQVTDGDSTLAVKWKADGSQTTDVFTVYVDSDPGAVCTNTMLQENMSASTADDLVDMIDEITSYETRGKSYDVLTERLGIEVGGFAAVFVSNEDVAGNRSDLSAMGCGERIATEGPIGAVERETGREVQSCNGSGDRGALGGSAATLMGLLGLWLVRRRGARA